MVEYGGTTVIRWNNDECNTHGGRKPCNQNMSAVSPYLFDVQSSTSVVSNVVPSYHESRVAVEQEVDASRNRGVNEATHIIDLLRRNRVLACERCRYCSKGRVILHSLLFVQDDDVFETLERFTAVTVDCVAGDRTSNVRFSLLLVNGLTGCSAGEWFASRSVMLRKVAR